MDVIKTGRPSKYCEHVKNMIIQGVASGLTLKASCRGAGISYSTFANWRQKYNDAPSGSVLKDQYKFIISLDAEIQESGHQHRMAVWANRKPRDYRHGWKNPMTDSTKNKLRFEAYKKVLKRILMDVGIFID